MPDTGSLRGDLVVFLSGLGAELANEQWSKSLPAMLDRAEHDADFAAHHQLLVQQKSAPLRQILERGRQRGEVRDDVNLDLSLAVLSGALFYRRLMVHVRTTSAQARPSSTVFSTASLAAQGSSSSISDSAAGWPYDDQELTHST